MIKLLYKIVNSLLYYKIENSIYRLYISSVLKKKVFKLIYNKIDYSRYIRIYKKLIIDLFIYNIAIKLYKYI